MISVKVWAVATSTGEEGARMRDGDRVGELGKGLLKRRQDSSP